MHIHYHLTGIAGVGMSALAEHLLDNGSTVSGSDRHYDHGTPHPTLLRLQRQGITLTPQDGSAIHPRLTALIVSTAIEPDNPEVLAARARAIPVLHRAEVLSTQFRAQTHRHLIGVAGTSGKSTTTAILGALLAGAGLDPVVVNGAPVTDWLSDTRTGSVRNGQGSWIVAELDESDRSILNFHPRHAIITNASADHFPLPETLDLFQRFRARVSGIVIDGIDPSPPPPAFIPLPWGTAFTWSDHTWHVPLPGTHNALNAWHALRLALSLDIPPPVLDLALRRFRGVERRLQLIGHRPDGIPVVDDYAHNTAKLQAALQTLSASSSRVLALWRPHGYAPLRAMLPELAEMFRRTCRPDDHLFLLPVYDAGGTANRTINSRHLAAALNDAPFNLHLVEDHPAAIAAINRHALPGDIIVTLGARDPHLPLTARNLLGATASS